MSKITTDKEIKKHMSKTQNISHKDDIFDLDKIPMETLDKGWKSYRPYMQNLDQTSPLIDRVAKSTNRNMIILYIHGLSSSGLSGTVDLLRRYFPQACIIAPDLPLDPTAALQLLRDTCETNHPDLIIGTSMGGMFAQMLHGYKKILVNPAFRLFEVLKTLKGENKFFNRRQDGVQTFIIDDALIAEYEKLAERQFDNIPEGENEITFGMFGREDDFVNDSDLFLDRYTNISWFDGGHRLNDRILKHFVVPQIHKIINE